MSILAFNRDNWEGWIKFALAGAALLGLLWRVALRPFSLACWKVIRIAELAEQHLFPKENGEPSTFDQLLATSHDHERRLTLLESRPTNTGVPPK